MALRNPMLVLTAIGWLTLSSFGNAADDSSGSEMEPDTFERDSGFPGIPVDILFYAILPHVDVQSVMHMAQVNHGLYQAILGSETGAQLLWLHLLVKDFNHLYPHNEFVPSIHVDELMKNLPKTNQFLKACREARKLEQQGMLTEPAYRTIMQGIKSPALRAKFIRRQEAHAQANKSLSWWQAHAQRVAYIAWFVSLLGGTVMEVVGSSRLPSAEGIALVSVGGVILAITIGSTFWYMCLSSQGTVFNGWGQHMTRVAKHRANSSEARSQEVRIRIEQQDN